MEYADFIEKFRHATDKRMAEFEAQLKAVEAEANRTAGRRKVGDGEMPRQPSTLRRKGKVKGVLRKM
ncbi:MAG: hypothetical protein Q4D85_12835 [Corynebacterium sp.]|uniref:hypothetical protein n=1 Tax=Corynebacterium sp. TaxID=1720 RepID=UPI0026DCF076|nr:hypothetical protein [Corynebacterium sp.]MDO5099618.1 hypothetical protein [Corynebacterium sp.]